MENILKPSAQANPRIAKDLGLADEAVEDAGGGVGHGGMAAGDRAQGAAPTGRPWVLACRLGRSGVWQYQSAQAHRRDLLGGRWSVSNRYWHSLCVTRAKNWSRAHWLSSTLTEPLLVERRFGE